MKTGVLSFPRIEPGLASHLEDLVEVWSQLELLGMNDGIQEELFQHRKVLQKLKIEMKKSRFVFDLLRICLSYKSLAQA